MKQIIGWVLLGWFPLCFFVYVIHKVFKGDKEDKELAQHILFLIVILVSMVKGCTMLGG